MFNTHKPFLKFILETNVILRFSQRHLVMKQKRKIKKSTKIKTCQCSHRIRLEKAKSFSTQSRKESV